MPGWRVGLAVRALVAFPEDLCSFPSNIMVALNYWYSSHGVLYLSLTCEVSGRSMVYLYTCMQTFTHTKKIKIKNLRLCLKIVGSVPRMGRRALKPRKIGKRLHKLDETQ